MYIINLFKHISLVFHHKHLVFVHCCKCGQFWRGLMHDWSKFSPTELFEAAKYYRGYRSPIGVCRAETGMSQAWLHHKGRNKHHIEYWFDSDCKEHPMMPYKYAVECVCDKLAATKTYNGKNYKPEQGLWHWDNYGTTAPGNEKTKLFIRTVFEDLVTLGEKKVLNKKYMRKTYDRICLGKEE